jgi:S-adenosylmethionine:tRNA ribosyltransferase-isomerase
LARRGLSPIFSVTIEPEPVRLSDFDYDLPEHLIAQTPLPDRAASRMLVVDRASGTWSDRSFRDLTDYLYSGDALVINNTKVLAGRLFGRRAGVHATTSKSHVTGLVEVLLLEKLTEHPPRWEALARPGRKLRAGERIHFPGGLEATIVSQGERGIRVVEFDDVPDFDAILNRVGHMPLPPYIKRSDANTDRERYQTIFANAPGAAAAPTAGLHFTSGVLEELRTKGIKPVEVTLHVGLGTFQPVEADDIRQHKMHAEHYEISANAARLLNAAPRKVAVGTTSVRTLEQGIREGKGQFQAASGQTSLFIYPGFDFQAVAALLTNFHLPHSTLLMLVSAFAGRELILDAYQHAVKENYRFFSYGDCMLII